MEKTTTVENLTELKTVAKILHRSINIALEEEQTAYIVVSDWFELCTLAKSCYENISLLHKGDLINIYLNHIDRETVKNTISQIDEDWDRRNIYTDNGIPVDVAQEVSSQYLEDFGYPGKLPYILLEPCKEEIIDQSTTKNNPICRFWIWVDPKNDKVLVQK